MDTTLTLTDDPAQHPHVFAAAFDSGDPDLLDRVYEGDGVLVAPDGRRLTGAARREANAALMGLGAPMRVRPRSVLVSGDLALLVVAWSLRGRARDGGRVDLGGTATDVARRGRDGLWRYVIDNPWGVADPPGAR